METDVYQVCSEAKLEVRFGENSTGSSLYSYVCGDSFADVECDDDSILNIIHTKLTCPATHPLRFHI